MFPPRNPPYSGTNNLPNVPATSQNAPLYTNGAMYPNHNTSPAYPPTQPQAAYARSQLQSPLSAGNKQNYPNMRMSNYNLSDQQNVQPAPHVGNSAMPNYGVPSQNQQMQMQQPQVGSQPPPNSNRMYQVNGYPPPQAPAQNYGQYPQAAQQFNNKYPPVRFSSNFQKKIGTY